MPASVELHLQTLTSLEEVLCQVAGGPLELPTFRCLFQLVTGRELLCFGREGKTGRELLSSPVVLLPAEETGSSPSEEQLTLWAGGMSLGRSPVSEGRVGGGAEQDIPQRHTREGVRAENRVSAAPGSAFRSSTARCRKRRTLYFCNH